MQLVLLGYMGSGKSSVGSLLAEALQYEFIDLDHYIATSEKATIGEIFRDKGEIYFRNKEAVVLAEILSEKNKIVLSTGGGTPCYGAIMADLKARENLVSIYLKNSLETLTHRLFQEKAERPLIAHLQTRELLKDFIRKHLFERSFYYNQAHITVDCDALSQKEIVEQLVLRLF